MPETTRKLGFLRNGNDGWMDGWMVNESGNRRRRTIRNANVKMEEKRPKYLLLRLLEKHGRRRRHKRPQITI